MSSKRVGNAWGDYELVRASQVVLRDLRKRGFDVTVRIDDSGFLGAFKVRATLTRDHAGEAEQLGAITNEWPNARLSSLPAHLFQALTVLAKMADDEDAPPF
jgi:hypothetical protein